MATIANMTLEDLQAWVEQHSWTPPPSAKSSLDLLRED